MATIEKQQAVLQLARAVGEEVLDLWNMTFPKSRGDWYDEQDDTIHFQENGDAVAHTD